MNQPTEWLRSCIGKVKKGEKSSLVVFWKYETTDKQTGAPTKIPVLRRYNLFNTEQVDDIEISHVAEKLFAGFVPEDAFDWASFWLTHHGLKGGTCRPWRWISTRELCGLSDGPVYQHFYQQFLHGFTSNSAIWAIAGQNGVIKDLSAEERS